MNSSPKTFLYGVPITNPDLAVGETAVYRPLEAAKSLLDHIPRLPHAKTVQDIHNESAKAYSNLNCLGTRIRNSDGTLGQYAWKTYGAIYENARKLGSAVLNLDLAPFTQADGYPACRFVAIFAKNSEAWVTTDLACSLYGMTSIPIFHSLGLDSLPYIFQQTEVETMFTTGNHLDQLIQDAADKKTFKLKTIISYDGFTSEQETAAQKAGIQLLSWEYLLEQGQKIIPCPSVNPETWFSLCYTSGTTGNPKAAILTHQNVVAAVGCYEVSKAFGLDTIVTGDVHLSYLPIAHIFERIWIQMVLARGVAIGFSQGDTQKLTEDMQILKPSYVISVPRLYNRFYENFQNAINIAMNRPLGTPIQEPIDPKILENLRQTTGGRAKFYFSASAPLSPGVHTFLRAVFGAPFMEGYGQTETASVCNTQDPADTALNSIGGVFNNTEYKLVDLPDMNYTAKDKGPNGESIPRGELCLRGPSIFKGYYKEHEKTAETIDKDGWHHTGDVAALLPNGDLKLIDRKKNIFKLAQAEFVAPDKIENIYLSNKYVAEMYVYGDSFRSNLVGIVVPDPENLKDLANQLEIAQTNLDDLCKEPRVVCRILEEINKTGKASRLAGYELVKNIHLEPQSLVVLGLTTPSMKLKRDVAKTHFKDIIERLYTPQPKL